MRVAAVAGTFAVLHDGHRSLFEKAFELGDRVLVGVTSDDMAASTRSDIIPLEIRLRGLERYLSTFEKPYEFMIIDDPIGPRDKMDQVDYLVVSEETRENGEAVVRDRYTHSVKALDLVVVPLRLTTDGEKISSTGILAGRYSRSGDTKALDVAVGSLNHVKVEAVRAVLERVYNNVRVTAVDVPSGVPDQPHEGATREGAVNRATAALPGHDMGVGVEAGVFERIDGLFDFQYCAVIDSSGRLTVGTGPGFQYPPAVASLVRGGLTVGEAMKRIFGETDIGKKQGAVGFLSNGLLDRETLTEQAVTAALIPRLNDSYVV